MVNTLKSKNKNWNVGDRVNVGFMKNLLVENIASIIDGKPDIYLLKSDKGVFYEFTPHNGIVRL